MKLASFVCAGALELWELAEDERLLVNRFTKHDHDHIVTTVSPVVGATAAVTGSMDCRLDLFSTCHNRAEAMLIAFVSNFGLINF